MTAIAAPRRGDEQAPAMPRMSIVLTSAFAVFTVGATVVVLAAFVALFVSGGAGAHALFALVAGALGFSTLVLLQFVQWAKLLLKHLRGNP